MTNEAKRGACLCGAVRFEVAGPLRAVVACHCAQCRKLYTNFAAFSAAHRGDLTFRQGDALIWYESSPGVRRGFCGRCGSSLFWDRANNDFVSVSAGALEQPSGLRCVRHIFVADKADFYEIGDGLETLPRGQGDDQWPQDDHHRQPSTEEH